MQQKMASAYGQTFSGAGGAAAKAAPKAAPTPKAAPKPKGKA